MSDTLGPSSRTSVAATSAVDSRKDSRFVVLRGHVHELGQVLDPALGVDGPAASDGDLGLERVAVAGALEEDLDQLVRRAVDEIAGAELVEQVEQAPDPDQGLARGAGLLGALERAGEPDPALGGEGDQAANGRVADAAPRRVQDAAQRHLVARVGDGAQVGEHVTDLPPVEETGPPDHGVGDPTIGQRRLEGAALRVRPVEDGDVAVADALVCDASVAISPVTKEASSRSSPAR